MEDVVKKKKKFPPEIVKGKKIAPIAVKEKKNSPLTQTSCSPPWKSNGASLIRRWNSH